MVVRRHGIDLIISRVDVKAADELTTLLDICVEGEGNDASTVVVWYHLNVANS